MSFAEPFLSLKYLKNLRFYKYSAVDKSPTTKYVLRHWWDLAARPFPSWMAPNVITLLGFLFIVANVVTAAVYDPLLQGIAPSWVYYSWAIGLFAYQTLDNVDGRQARRTGTSSALGHWFDHGVDSLNCPLGGLLQVAATGLGSTKRGAIIIFVGCWAMWSSTWEEYYTHTLYLGYFNAPTEGLLLAMLTHLVSGYYGPNIWKSPVSLPIDSFIIEIYGKQLALDDLFVLFVVIGTLVVHTPACFVHVKQAAGKDYLQAFSTYSVYLFYNGLAAAWLWSPNSSILSDGLLFEFAILLTCTFGILGPRVILAYLTLAPFPRLTLGAYGPLMIGVAVVYIAPALGFDPAVVKSYEITCLHIGAGFAFVTLGWWTIEVCSDFCTVLGINCFTIKQKVKTE